MRRKPFDPTKSCSWCNSCPSSFCDCGPCKDENCEYCVRIEDAAKPKPLPESEPKSWNDSDSEGAGGDG